MSNEGRIVDLIKNFNSEIDKKIADAEQLLVRAVNYSKAGNTSLTEMYEIVIRAKEVHQGLSILKQLENSWVEVASKKKANQSEDDKRLIKELVIETTMVYEKFAAMMIDLNGVLAKST